MAKRSWLGHAAGVKQVDTITVADTWATGDTIVITIDNISYTITVGSLDATTEVATTIKQAFNGETLTDTTATVTPNSGVQSLGQFAEITATVSGSVVTLTANTASRPFILSVTETTAGDGTATEATATTCTGSSFFSQQDNWSANTVPVDADDIVFEQGSQSCQDGLEPAIQPGTFYHYMSFTGWIGRPERNATNVAKQYSEYRTKALTFDDNGGATGVYRLGLGSGQGATGIRLNTGAGLATFIVYKSRQKGSDGVPNILLRGTANNTLQNMDGTVGVGFYAGESTTLTSLINGKEEGQSNADTYCGVDVTLSSATVRMLGGRLETNSAISVVNVIGGQHTHNLGAIATLNLYKNGSLKIRSSAALTITTGYVDGVLDLSEASGTITFTNCQFGPNARVFAPNGNIAFTNPYTEERGYSANRKLNFGIGRTYALT
jgi:hypothetical protein